MSVRGTEGLTPKHAAARRSPSSDRVEFDARMRQACRCSPAGPSAAPLARRNHASRISASASRRPVIRTVAAAARSASRCRQTPANAGVERTMGSRAASAAPAKSAQSEASTRLSEARAQPGSGAGAWRISSLRIKAAIARVQAAAAHRAMEFAPNRRRCRKQIMSDNLALSAAGPSPNGWSWAAGQPPPGCAVLFRSGAR